MAPLQTPWPRNFRPKPGNFASIFNTLHRQIGTGGVALTGTATTTVWVGVPRARTFAVINASMQGGGAAAGGGAITAQLIANQSGTDRTLTAATSITATVISGNNIEWTITPASPGFNVLTPGDTLRWEVVAATTVTTAPVLTAVVEAAIIS